LYGLKLQGYSALNRSRTAAIMKKIRSFAAQTGGRLHNFYPLCVKVGNFCRASSISFLEGRSCMKRWIYLSISALFVGTVFISIGFAQSSGTSEPRFVTIGDVSKIDPKGKSITIKDATSFDIPQTTTGEGGTARGGGRHGGGGVRVGGGGGGRRGGGGGNSGGGSAVGGARGPSAPVPTEYKVVVSSRTLFKEGDNPILFGDLKIGDRIQVFSAKGGSKLEASEIIRTPRN